MAKITVAGESVVVTSDVKLEDYKVVAKYRPEVLQLKGGEGNKEVVFAIGITSNPRGSINQVGAEFGAEAHDGSGKATITLELPRVDGDVKETVAEMIGAAILSLNKIEENIPSIIEEINTERANILSNIDVQ